MKKSELRQIPGVGPKTEQDLLRLGYSTIASLRGADPEELYQQDCAQRALLLTAASFMFTAVLSIMLLPPSQIPNCYNGGNGKISPSTAPPREGGFFIVREQPGS